MRDGGIYGLMLQDVDRIETQGPRLEDLVHTHVVEESDAEEGTEANKVINGLESGVLWASICGALLLDSPVIVMEGSGYM